MTEQLFPAFYVIGGVTFFVAFLLSLWNYRTTSGITNYWLFVAIAAFMGAAWAGSFIATDVLGITYPVIHDLQAPLAATTLLGYTVSLVKAVTADVITEIV